MSLNNISLPAQLLADLYQHSLVEGVATTVPGPAAVPQPAVLPFLGKNQKNILIIVSRPAVPYLPDGELDFLTKILTACQLSLMDVAIVNWAKTPKQNTADVLSQFSAKAVLLFNVEAEQFGLPPLPLYAVHQQNNVPFVVAPALDEIEKTKEAKNQLWLALKQTFGL